MNRGPLIVLVGPMGVGKSTVGALLAERLSVPFLDTDQDVVHRTGRSVAEIVTEDGEPRFRELEHEAVARAVAGFPGVLALGGGAVGHGGSRALLAGLPVIFLDVDLAEAMRRIGSDTGRPLLAADPERRWQELQDERRALYLEVARFVVRTDGRTPEQVARTVAAAVAVDTERGVTA
ncbi:shikimate kinase [Streptomyces goshikiensis]|uniref:shikimate kinase n=1 Tax=Streptomyces goshikiensis TaxID=1942 RepID=UPI0036AD1F88